MPLAEKRPDQARMFKIRLLGAPALMVDGVPFVLHASKGAFSLLAFLALHADEAVTRDAVAFALWPDQDEDAARATLRRHVHRLSKALPAAAEPWLAVDGRRYLGLNPRAPIDIDVRAFETALAAGDDAGACAAYGGDLCGGFDDEWLDAPRERLRGLQIAALGRLARTARADRRFDDAAATLARLLAFEPFDEETVRGLMSVRDELGDRAGALAAYERFAEQLRRELNTAPMPETRARYEAIRDGKTIAGEPASQPEASDSARHALPFLGRRDECARAEAWLRRPDAGARVFVVNGVAGIGKSRFAEVVSLAAERMGIRVVVGATSSPESRPYEAIVRALVRLAPLLSDTAREGLAGLVRPAPAGQAVPVAGRSREQLFENIACALDEASRSRRLLVVLEDVHWAGTSTVALVEYLTHYAFAGRCDLMLTLREDEAQRGPIVDLRRRLASDGHAVSISLCELDAADVAPLTHGAQNPAFGMSADDLVARSGGNPLFLASLLELGSDAATLEETLRARFLRLPPDAREVATAAAVFGRTFDAERVGRLTGESEGSVLRALGALLDARLVRDGGSGAGFGFSFSHALIRDTAYGFLSDTARKRRHARAAALVEEEAAVDAALAFDVATHYHRANLATEAARWYRHAADHAYAAYASEEALRLATEGIALTSERDVRVALLLVREAAARRLGRVADSLADLRELDALAGDDRETGWEIGLRRVFLGNFKYDVDIAESGLRGLERFADTPGRRATALDMRAQIDAGRERPEAAIAGFGEAAEQYALIGDARSRLRCEIWLFQQNALLDRHADGPRARETIVRDVEAFGNDALRLWTGGVVCGAGSLAIEDSLMLGLCEQFVATAERLKSNWYLGFALDSLAERLCYAKRTAEADLVLERARTFWQTGSATAGLWEQRKLQVDVQAGRFADAFRRADACDVLLAEIERPLAPYLTSLHRLEAAVESDDIAAAHDYAAEFRKRLEAVRYTLYRRLALLPELRFRYAAGDYAAVVAMGRTIATEFASDDVRYRRLLIGSAQFHALAALALGDVAEAQNAVAAIARAFEPACAAGYSDGAVAAYAVARTCRQTGREADAERWFERARTELDTVCARFGDSDAAAAYRRRPVVRDIDGSRVPGQPLRT